MGGSVAANAVEMGLYLSWISRKAQPRRDGCRCTNGTSLTIVQDFSLLKKRGEASIRIGSWSRGAAHIYINGRGGNTPAIQEEEAATAFRQSIWPASAWSLAYLMCLFCLSFDFLACWAWKCPLRGVSGASRWLGWDGTGKESLVSNASALYNIKASDEERMHDG